MKVDVRFHGLEGTPGLRQHAEQRAQALLRRFSRAVSAVVVRIADVNGPKGGVDKRCQVTVRGPGLDASSRESSADAWAAVDAAVARAAAALGRALDRSRSLRRRSPAPYA